MERDLDLVRKILLAVEDWPEPDDWIPLDIKCYTPEQISYHVKLLAQGGLIEANNLSSKSTFKWKATSLTWEGHEFLDASRNDGIWQQAKSMIEDKGLGMTFDMIKELLINLASKQLLG